MSIYHFEIPCSGLFVVVEWSEGRLLFTADEIMYYITREKYKVFFPTYYVSSFDRW